MGWHEGQIVAVYDALSQIRAIANVKRVDDPFVELDDGSRWFAQSGAPARRTPEQLRLGPLLPRQEDLLQRRVLQSEIMELSSILYEPRTARYLTKESLEAARDKLRHLVLSNPDLRITLENLRERLAVAAVAAVGSCRADIVLLRDE